MYIHLLVSLNNPVNKLEVCYWGSSIFCGLPSESGKKSPHFSGWFRIAQAALSSVNLLLFSPVFPQE